MCAKWHMRQQQKVGCSPDDLLLRYRAHKLELFYMHQPVAAVLITCHFARSWVSSEEKIFLLSIPIHLDFSRSLKCPHRVITPSNTGTMRVK